MCSSSRHQPWAVSQAESVRTRIRNVMLLLAVVVVSALQTFPTAAAGEGPRDLAIAKPESMGVSSERLKRLDAGFKRFVDDQRMAGVVTTPKRWRQSRSPDRALVGAWTSPS